MDIRWKQQKGGRPSNNYMETIEELKRRCPKGSSFSSMTQLKEANPDLSSAIKTLSNNSTKLFGMSLAEYFKKIGLLNGPEKVTISGDKLVEILKEPEKRIVIEETKYKYYKLQVKGLKSIFWGKSEDENLNIGDYVEVVKDQDHWRKHRLTTAEIVGVSYIKENSIPTSALEIKRKIDKDKHQKNVYYFEMNEDKTIIYNLQAYQDIKSIEIPEGVLEIKESACERYENLSIVKLNTGLKIIGKNAFSKTNLKNVMIPSSVEYIEVYAFSCGYSHTTVLIQPGNKHYRTDGKCLFKINSDGSEDLMWCFNNENPISYTVPDTVRTIKEFAFSNCALENVYLNNGLEIIEEKAFYNSGINRLELPYTVKNEGDISQTTIYSTYTGKPPYIQIIRRKEGEDYFVENDTEYLKIDGGYELIFSDSSQRTFTVKEGTIRIKSNAFSRNEYVKKIIFPQSLKELEDNAFKDSVLTEISVNKNNKYFCDVNGILYNKAKTKIIIVPPFHMSSCIKIDDSVEDISRAFENTKNIKELILSHKIKKLEKNAFINTNISDIVIESNVTEIGENIFDKYKKIIVRTNKNSCVEKYIKEFYDQIVLIDINDDKATAEFKSNYRYEIKNNMVYIKLYIGDEKTKLIVPNNVEGKPIVGISLFNSDNKNINTNILNINTIILPNSLKVIGKEAFSHCCNIEKMIIPDGVLEIHENAFTDCVHLNMLYIPKSVNYISKDFFKQDYYDYWSCRKIKIYLHKDSYADEFFTSYKEESPIGKIISIVYTEENSTTIEKNMNKRKTDITTMEDLEKVLDIFSLGYIDKDNKEEHLILNIDEILNNTNVNTYCIYDIINIPESEIVIVPNSIMGIPVTKFDVPFLCGEDTTGLIEMSQEMEEYLEEDIDIDYATIGEEYAKEMGYYIKELIIPENISEINSLPYTKKIKLDKKNKNFVIVDGMILSYDRTKLIRVYDKWHNHDIPDTVTEICEYAFEGCNAIELFVKFGKNVKTVSKSAFEDCAYIYLEIPKSLQNMEYAKWIDKCVSDITWFD